MYGFIVKEKVMNYKTLKDKAFVEQLLKDPTGIINLGDTIVIRNSFDDKIECSGVIYFIYLCSAEIDRENGNNIILKYHFGIGNKSLIGNREYTYLRFEDERTYHNGFSWVYVDVYMSLNMFTNRYKAYEQLSAYSLVRVNGIYTKYNIPSSSLLATNLKVFIDGNYTTYELKPIEFTCKRVILIEKIYSVFVKEYV